MSKIVVFHIVLLISLMGFIVPVAAEVSIDKESFAKQYVSNPPNGDKLIEFIRASEDFNNWTKLVGYRYQKLPKLGNDPIKVAEGMAQLVKKTNPEAQCRVVINKQRSEALIDFLTWPPDMKYMEFNVFRYAKSKDGKAVISLQLARRFADKSLSSPEQLKKIRTSWINQAAVFDMKKVHSAFNQ